MTSSGRRPRILVVGGGPAGLSAAAHLLEQGGGEVSVELVTMGHHLGGKASSWRDADGFSVDHGFHAVFGYYEELRHLARRAGVDLSGALVKSGGASWMHDGRSGGLFELRLSRNPLLTLARLSSFPGLGSLERDRLADAAVRIGRTLSRTRRLEALDPVSFRSFLLEHGAPPSFLGHPAFRQVEELAFHHPNEVSAYIALRGAQLMGHCYDDAAFSYIAGGISEKFWEPIGAYLERLGGKLTRRRKLVRLEHRDRKLVAAHFGSPDATTHHSQGQSWPEQVPVAEGSLSREEVDALVCTLPAACFGELNFGDSIWEDPFFGDIRRLRSVSTLSLQLWLREPTGRRARGVVMGLPLPLSYAVDYKPLVPEFRRDHRYGAALEWVGTEAGFEGLSEDELASSALAALSKVQGFEGCERAEVVHRVLRRNRANHQRYLLTEPGSTRYRPTSETPLGALFLAGDWIRNEVDIPTMEGAIRSGKAAAALALEQL